MLSARVGGYPRHRKRDSDAYARYAGAIAGTCSEALRFRIARKEQAS